MDPAGGEQQDRGLRDLIIPSVRDHPGSRAGYWMRDRRVARATPRSLLDSEPSARAFKDAVLGNALNQAKAGITNNSLAVVELLAEAHPLRSSSDHHIAFRVGSLSILAGMVLAGVGVLRAGRWTGPGRFLPLITGLYVIPLTGVIIAGRAQLAALTGYSVLWLLLGLSLYSVTRAHPPAQGTDDRPELG